MENYLSSFLVSLMSGFRSETVQNTKNNCLSTLLFFQSLRRRLYCYKIAEKA